MHFIHSYSIRFHTTYLLCICYFFILLLPNIWLASFQLIKKYLRNISFNVKLRFIECKPSRELKFVAKATKEREKKTQIFLPFSLSLISNIREHFMLIVRFNYAQWVLNKIKIHTQSHIHIDKNTVHRAKRKKNETSCNNKGNTDGTIRLFATMKNC